MRSLDDERGDLTRRPQPPQSPVRRRHPQHAQSRGPGPPRPRRAAPRSLPAGRAGPLGPEGEAITGHFRNHSQSGSAVLYSDDQGDTWQVDSFITDYLANEASAVSLPGHSAPRRGAIFVGDGDGRIWCPKLVEPESCSYSTVGPLTGDQYISLLARSVMGQEGIGVRVSDDRWLEA